MSDTIIDRFFERVVDLVTLEAQGPSSDPIYGKFHGHGRSVDARQQPNSVWIRHHAAPRETNWSTIPI